MNYYEHHLGDYAQATAHLTMLEDAAYSRMLRWYYANEKPLPREIKQIERLIRAQSKPEKQAVLDVLNEFFVLAEDGWHQDRADREIERYKEGAAEREQKNANEKERMRRHREERSLLFAELRSFGITPKWDTPVTQLREILEHTCNAPATRTGQEHEHTCNAPATANQTPNTRHQTPKEKPTPKPPSRTSALDGFDEFWAAYPKKVGKDAAFKAWKKLKKPAQTLEAIHQALSWQTDSSQWRKNSGQFIPNPATYLNEGRWQDEKPVDGIDEWLQEQNTIEGEFHVT